MYNSTILCCTCIYIFLDWISGDILWNGVPFLVVCWNGIGSKVKSHGEFKTRWHNNQDSATMLHHGMPNQAKTPTKMTKHQNDRIKWRSGTEWASKAHMYLCSMNCERDDYNLWTNIAPKCQVLKSLCQVWWLMNIFASINTNTLLSRISVGVWK